jgi:predicted N-acetyltransferase YhbS
MQNIIIRRARKKDCPRLLELIKESAESRNASDKVTISLDDFEESGFGTNPVWWAFVAEIKGVVYGVSLYYIRFSTWTGKRMCLAEFYVSKEMQRNGIGKLLFDQLFIEAKEQEYKGIAWYVQERNHPLINFYKKYHTQFDSGWIRCILEIRR